MLSIFVQVGCTYKDEMHPGGQNIKLRGTMVGILVGTTSLKCTGTGALNNYNSINHYISINGNSIF